MATAKRTNTDTKWRPAGWSKLDGCVVSIEEALKLFDAYKEQGYLNGSKLSKKGLDAADADEALVIVNNVARLRDSWNTPAYVWELAEHLTGQPFRVDPFWNPGAMGLTSIAVKLDGTGDQEDDNRPTSGLAVNDAGFPVNWRGKLKKGKAAAAVNGPHSDTERWLKLCKAYGEEEFCAAFVPANGDAWYNNIGFTASLVVSLSRVACAPPPGIKASSPRGASALLIWIPPTFDVKRLPKETQGVLKGKTISVPIYHRPRAGVQHAYVQPGNITRQVDFFGLLKAAAS